MNELSLAQGIDRLADHLLIDAKQRIVLEQYVAVLGSISHKPDTVLTHWLRQQDQLWNNTIADLHINTVSPQHIQVALSVRLTVLQQLVRASFPTANLGTVAGWNQFINTLLPHIPPTALRGRFIKWSVLQQFLIHTPPPRLLAYLDYQSITDCLAHEPIEEMMAALRFTESADWMEHFLQHYHHCQPHDFEERPVRFLLLEPTKWWSVAEAFARKKKHHFSHLKEAGVVFSYPAPNWKQDNQTLPLFTLMVLHYIYEVHFYARWIEQHIARPHFTADFVRILKGDGSICATSRWCLPIVQQYHLKRPQPHPCAYLPHVMPEAIHWHKAFQSFFNLIRTQPEYHLCAFWESCYTVGRRIDQQLITFNLADNILSNMGVSAVPLSYHYNEDVWNAIFSSYLNRGTLERVIIEQLASQHINLHHL